MIAEDEVVERARVDQPPRSLRHWITVAALSAMLFAITKGPVYWARGERARWTGDPIDDVWVQATFVALSALVLVLAVPGAAVLRRDRVVVGVFGAFVGAVLASSLWSVAPDRTLEQSLMLLLGTAAALLAGTYLRRFDVLVAVWVAMQVGVLVSAFAWWRDWPRAVLKGRLPGINPDQFTGIYFSANSLGPVAVLAAASALTLLAATSWRRSMLPVKAILAGLAALDGYVWLVSGSMAPLLAMCVAALATGTAVMLLPGRAAGTRRAVTAISSVVAMLAGLVFLARRGQAPTFTGRTDIWDTALEVVAERPIQGWGFMAIWLDPVAGRALLDIRILEAHSGYVEVLLGVGIIGLTLLLAAAAVALARTWSAFRRRPGVISAAWFGAVVYALAINFAETYVGANLLPWALLCVATGGAVAARARPPGGATDDAELDAEADDAPADDTEAHDAPVDPPGGEPATTDDFDWASIDEIIGVSFEADPGHSG